MITNEVIWITGASSGLGQSLARLLAANNTLILSGRNRVELIRLKAELNQNHSLSSDADDHSSDEGESVIVFPCDLTAISSTELEHALAEHTQYLDRIILSAGDCKYLDVDDSNWQCVDDIMSINFSAAVNCIKASLPLLQQGMRGHIVAITSLATEAPFPKAEAYGASKAALSYFLRSLRMDLHSKNLDVTDVKPGFIDTPLTQKNTFDMPFLMSSDDAAKKILRGIEHRPMVFTFPKRLSWLFKLLNRFPKLWMRLNDR